MRRPSPRLAGTTVVLVGFVSLLTPFLASVPASADVIVADTPPAATDELPDVEVHEVAVPDAGVEAKPKLAARSAPQPVDGFGVVGATWEGEAPEGLSLAIRTRTAGTWSQWTPLYVTHDHDGGSTEDAEGSREGSEPFVVGEVDVVQLRAHSLSGEAPADLELSVVDPGETPAEEGSTATTASTVAQPIALTSAVTQTVARKPKKKARGVRAPKPRLRTRAEWGVDPRLRSGSPSYGSVRAGFVHHTVNANRYTRKDVPAIIRGIYAYHTKSRGWSDIGYNFVVDKFGRKWVGRTGGKRRPVVGAHAYGYNHLSTGVAVIGNFETRKPSRRVLHALGRLLAWKLGHHGVRVGKAHWLEGERFGAINGHRDVGSTACPGIKLYRRLPEVRRVAIRWQNR